MPDRLFLFAGFNKDCIIDDALLYYVKSLSKYGDVILCMDCDCKKSEIEKIKKYTIHTVAKRHSEYDFGSYKRCFDYAHDNKLLEKYKYIYFMNDSVFGPFYDIKKTLEKLENNPADTCGMVVSKHKTHTFIESWFIRLNKKVFTSSWFYDFMHGVKKVPGKTEVTIKYEHGLSNLVQNNGCSLSGLFIQRGRFTYNNPKYLFKHGCPFIKKLSFTRHNGSLGAQIKYILKHCDKHAAKATIKTANYLYGEKYVNWLLTYNPLKILYRTIIYTRYRCEHIFNQHIWKTDSKRSEKKRR